MTAQEVLIKLINLGIVHNIGDVYSITSKVTDAMDEIDEASTIAIPVINTGGELYPQPIREASSSKKAQAVLNYCEVPGMILRSGSKFMVRSDDKQTRAAVLRLIKDQTYDPTIILKVIKDYYAYMEYPKAFKRILLEGDLDSLYKYYKEGNSLSSTEKPTNEQWQ
jgi:hypothetical protein